MYAYCSRSSLIGSLLLLAASAFAAEPAASPQATPDPFKAPSPGCEKCHEGIEPMHPGGEPVTCVGCHGGNGTATTAEKAHVQPTRRWLATGRAGGSANPVDVYGDLMAEPAAYVRFRNPGDLRIAQATCGSGDCHQDVLQRMRGSIMATSANVPGAVLYDNGAHPSQRALYGESFLADGAPAELKANPPPTDEQQKKGAVPFLRAMARWEATATPDIFRIFDRGNDAGGVRGRGTDFKVAGVFLNLVKTRLNDPALWLPGTNGGAGDYRESGCTACHVLYANDGDPLTAGPAAGHGNVGETASGDKAIPRGESGHPLKHQLTRQIPVSQCLTCHHHQGNGALPTYAGYVWHDQETEIEQLIKLSGLPGDPGQASLAASNDKLQQTQFADFHGHKWNFRAVYWTDRRGNLLDPAGKVIDWKDPDHFKKAVHLKDIHLEKGMQCVDCHLERDMHGDGFLYGAMVDAIEIRCQDCHGTVNQRATLETTGAAAGPRNLLSKTVRTPFRKPQFYKRENKLYQRSMVDPDKEWEIPQVVDVVDPASPSFNAKAARAMRLPNRAGTGLAHPDDKVECFSCHSAWNTNCYGCHLPFDANVRAKDNHTGQGFSRGYAMYNPQEIRTDSYTLGINGNVQGNKWCPIRSASAVVVSAMDGARNVVVNQQPTLSSSGLAGAAITPNIPHTVRGRQTKECRDCHVSERGDNNAVMASITGQGTNGANWMGDYLFVAAGSEIAGIRITEGYEPRPVIGSDFHRALHPESAQTFQNGGRRLPEAHLAGAKDARAIAVVGEWALVADGSKGMVVYDVANVANKGVAQRIVKSPVTVLGQSLRVSTPDANWVALPAGLPMDSSREKSADRIEPKVASRYEYAFIADGKLGLVATNIRTLFDANPSNNWLSIASQFNPGGALDGARHISFDGKYALVSCTRGLAIIDVENPLAPKLVAQLGAPDLARPRSSVVQFRFAFVSDVEGVAVVDLTDPTRPATVARIHMDDARMAVPYRTWLYVAAGKQGLGMVDVTSPERPGKPTFFGKGRELSEAISLAIGSTNASTFAFVADGDQGMKLLSLLEPARVPGHLGFAPAPDPKLIATWKGATGPVVAVAEGVKRDRYVDESGDPISVGGRIGSRPLNLAEMQQLYLDKGKVWTVSDVGPPPMGPLVVVKESHLPVPTPRPYNPPTALPEADAAFCSVLGHYIEAADKGFNTLKGAAEAGGLIFHASEALPGALACALYLEDPALMWARCQMLVTQDNLQAIEVRRALARRVERCVRDQWSMSSGVRLDGAQAFVDFDSEDPLRPSLTVSSTRDGMSETVDLEVTVERPEGSKGLHWIQ